MKFQLKQTLFHMSEFTKYLKKWPESEVNVINFKAKCLWEEGIL